jgi:hypothetical protein
MNLIIEEPGFMVNPVSVERTWEEKKTRSLHSYNVMAVIFARS